jgi:RNA polymerase sigma-70 factor (ECF subfamily)
MSTALAIAPPAVSVEVVKPAARAVARTHDGTGPDAESRGWVTDLRGSGQEREEAVARLHELLLRAARFEVNRRRATLPRLRGDDFDDLAMQSADDALVAILAKLDTYRGDSKFTTWAYKFALLEAAVKLRRRAWQGREIPLEPEAWPLFEAGDTSPESGAERSELFRELERAISNELTPHQREVLVATTLNGVPIDVLAERLNTTRGALYKTLHDARQKLRTHLAAQGMAVGENRKEEA